MACTDGRCGLTIGRIGGLTIDAVPASASYAGDRMTLDLRVTGEAGDVTQVVEHLRAYVDSVDEPVVPVVGDGPIGHLTGYYRVLDASADQGWVGDADLKVTLERVAHASMPRFEATLLGGPRPYDHPGIAPDYWWAASAATAGLETGVVTPVMWTRQSEDGPIECYADLILADSRGSCRSRRIAGTTGRPACTSTGWSWLAASMCSRWTGS